MIDEPAIINDEGVLYITEILFNGYPFFGQFYAFKTLNITALASNVNRTPIPLFVISGYLNRLPEPETHAEKIRRLSTGLQNIVRSKRLLNRINRKDKRKKYKAWTIPAHTISVSQK